MITRTVSRLFNLAGRLGRFYPVGPNGVGCIENGKGKALTQTTLQAKPHTYSTSRVPLSYTKAQSLAEFNAWSENYDSSPLQGLLFTPSHNCLMDHIAMNSNSFELLDIGCGTGVFAERIIKRFPGSKVSGVDLSPQMISRALRRSEHIPDLQFLQADCESLPFSDGNFDIITCSNSFHHYPNQAKAVAEMYRVLKPDGKLMIIDGYRDRTWGGFIYDVCVVAVEGAVHHASAGEFHELFHSAGFDDIQQQAKLSLAPFLLTMGTKAKN